MVAGVAYGIVALIGWGLADFLAKGIIDRYGDVKALFWIQFLSLIPLAGFYFAVDGRIFFPAIDYLYFILISMFSIVGYLLFYRAIKLGNISIISPVQATVVVGTLILAALFLAERLALLEYAAIAVVSIGLILTGINLDALRTSRRISLLSGIRENLISIVLFSIHFILIGFIVPKLGWLAPIFFFRVCNVLFLLVYLGFTKQAITVNLNQTSAFAFLLPLTAVFDVAAILGFSLGVNSEYVSIVAPIASSFPLVTVALAGWYYKERLGRIQIVGILLLIFGIVALAALS